MPDDITPGGVAGGQGSATPPAAPPAAPAAPPAAPAAPVDMPFYGTFEDANLKTWAEGKGWKSAEAAVKSAFHLEKMVGAPADSVLRVPVQGDAEGWKSLHQRLGTPSEASEYEVPGADASNEAYTNQLKDVFLKAGLTKDQAKVLMEANNEMNTAAVAKESSDYEVESQAADNELRREWGNGYETQKVVATQAAQTLGFTEGMLDGIEQAIGYKETMKFMADLGAKLGEDKFVAGGGNLPPGAVTQSSTPAQAQAAWDQFKSDPNALAALTDKRNPGHAAAIAKKAEIFSVMYPG